MVEFMIEYSPFLVNEKNLKESRSVVVFDLDGTLYDVNTLYGFLEFFYKKKSLTKYSFFRLSRSIPGKVFWYIITKITPGELFRNIALSAFHGADVDAIADACELYVTSVLQEKHYDEPMKLLVKHLEQKDYVVLISGSADPIVNAVADHLGIEHYYSLQLEKVNGTYTGNVLNDVRGDKLNVVKKKVPIFNGFLVVTDNKDDIDLVTEAVQAFVVTRKKNKFWWESQMLNNIELIEV